jgi:hypothetical protein
MSATMSAAIAGAVDDLAHVFGEVEVEPDGQGGAYVTVRNLDLGDRWSPRIVALSFQLAYNYPHAAVYPYFGPAGIMRTDGGLLPSALQQIAWRGELRTQISLRANRWSPTHDTAAGAVAQVCRFFRTVP